MYEDGLTKKQCIETCEILKGFYLELERKIYKKQQYQRALPGVLIDARHNIFSLEARAKTMENNPDYSIWSNITSEVSNILKGLALVEKYFS